MSRRLAGVGSAFVVLLALAACSGACDDGHKSMAPNVSARQADAIRQSMHCDRHRHQPIGASPFRSGKAPGIRSYPAVAMICEYEFWPYQNRRARLTGQVTLGARAADGLAAIVDSARTVHPEASSCGGDLARHSHAVVILFGYAGSHVISAAAHQPFCNDQGNILTGGRSFRVPWPVLDALMAPATNSAGNNGPPAPHLTGLSMAAATAAASGRG